jgi:NADPH:quinone reductase-like Zn-dependent oxidoreductase
MSQMKVVRYYPPGGLEKLKFQDEPMPAEVKENEVLIKVHAVGLIWTEYTWPIYQNAEGEYISHILGHDFSGVVVEMGPETHNSGLKPGSEVYAFTSRRNHEGAMAEYAKADIDQVLPKPKNLSFVEAATVPLSALTAWQALFDHGNLQKGQRLLVTGAAGGTGVFAVQFALHIGAYVIGTGSSDRSREILEKLGVNKFVNYKTQDLKTEVGEVDLVLECVGGKSLENAVSVVKKDGFIISIADINCEKIAEQKGVRGMFFIVSMNAEELSAITKLIESGKVVPFVDKTFSLENVQQAFKEASFGHVHGKAIINVVE